jgi:hypothetical protein
MSTWVTGCVLLTSVSALALAKHCPRLRLVNFDFCDLLSDSVVALANLSHLRSASFGGCSQLTNGAVVELAAVLSKNPTVLSHLDFESCPLVSDAALVALFKHCPLLRDVVLPSGTLYSKPSFLIDLAQ